MVTRVFVQNNTPFDFHISVNRHGAALADADWEPRNGDVPRGSRVEAVSFNRDSGITNGKRFFFDVRLQRSDTTLVLRQQLRGAFIGSHLWQSLAGPGFEHGWTDDRNTHTAVWATPTESIDVSYRAYFTGGDDDIEYILHYIEPVVPSGPDTLDVLAYNIYMRPTSLFLNGQVPRSSQLAAALHGYDVIVFSEAFDDECRARLLASLTAEYPHVSRIVGTDRGFEQDGGVIAVSRWPIVTEDALRFGDVSAGSDTHADKGVLYIAIDKAGRRHHIFGTHTQAHNDQEDRAIRAAQFRMIQEFIAGKQIHSSEPVVIVGDLNVNRGNTAEYEQMLSLLHATDTRSQGLPFSYHPAINTLASEAGDELLDYVLWSSDHLAPSAATSEIRLVRARTEWKDVWVEKANWELSDHFPIYGRLDFPQVSVSIGVPVDLEELEKAFSKDSDGDGVTDMQEAQQAAFEAIGDSDHDGLKDSEEAAVFGTDPTKNDTDGDGLSDGAEVLGGTDPTQ